MRQHISKRIEEQRLQHQKKEEERKKQFEEQKKGKTKKLTIISSAVVLVLLVFGYFVYSSSAKPGILDDFSKCLAEKGVVMYGADWCQYTQAQRAMFGKSFKYLNYKDISERGNLNIKVTPTWVIDDKFYEKVQPFDKLAALTGCELPKPE